MTWPRPRLVVAALLAGISILVAALGALDHVPTWARVVTQAGGTLVGVALGAKLTNDDDRAKVEASAKAALANLFALAASVRHILVGLDAARRRATSPPPATISAATSQTETLLDGLEVQARTLLDQAKAAAEAWQPYVDPAWVRERGGQP